MNKCIKIALCALGFLNMPIYPLDFRDVATTAAKTFGNLGLACATTYAIVLCHELGHALTFRAFTGKSPK